MSSRPPGSLILLLVPLALAACGDLPRPFMGRPGGLADQLSRPPPARLAVPSPDTALLSNDAAKIFAAAVADFLVEQSIPAIAGPAKPGDWRLVLTAETHGATVIPTYTIQNPAGVPQGSTDGAPVAAGAWAAGDEAALKTEAEATAPAIANQLTAIAATIQQNDPNSLVNRPARIQLIGVTGAPGDGNQALARQVRTDLLNLGLLVQDAAAKADFTLRCEIKTAHGTGDTTRVEIQWIVDDAGGPERGRIVQINEVPPGTLDRYWGDVAVVVAQQAAGGVREVILNTTAAHRLAGDKPDPAPNPAKP